MQEEVMGTRMTIDQLEQMKTHELADLLANVVLLLRRMPDVACKQLVEQVPGNEFLDPPKVEQRAMPAASLTREGLAKRKVAELKTLAKSADGYSEQRAIRDL